MLSRWTTACRGQASTRQMRPSCSRRSNHMSICYRRVSYAVPQGRRAMACAFLPDRSRVNPVILRLCSRRPGRRILPWRRRTASWRPNFSGRRSIVPRAMLPPTTGRAVDSTGRRSCWVGWLHGSRHDRAPKSDASSLRGRPVVMAANALLKPRPMVKPERCWPWLERRGLQSTARCSSGTPKASPFSDYGNAGNRSTMRTCSARNSSFQSRWNRLLCPGVACQRGQKREPERGPRAC
jgi:hypothetical protein